MAQYKISENRFALQEGDIWARDTVKYVKLYGGSSPNHHLKVTNPDKHVDKYRIKWKGNGEFYNVIPEQCRGYTWGMIGVTYSTYNLSIGDKCVDHINQYTDYLFLPAFTALCGSGDGTNNAVSALNGMKKPQNAEYPSLIDFDVAGFGAQLLAYKKLATKNGVTMGQTYKQHIIKSASTLIARYLTRRDKIYLDPYNANYKYLDDKGNPTEIEVPAHIAPSNEMRYFQPIVHQNFRTWNKEEILKYWYNFKYWGSNLMLPKFTENKEKKEAWVKQQWEALKFGDDVEFISSEQLIYDALDSDTRTRLVLSKCFSKFYDWNDDYIIDVQGVKCKVDIANEKFLDPDTGEEIPFVIVYTDDTKSNVEYIMTFDEYRSALRETYNDEDRQIQADVVKALQDGTAMPSSQNCNPRPSMRKWTNVLYYEPDRPDKIKEKEEALKTEEELAENPVEERQTRYTLWMGKYLVKYQHYYTERWAGDYNTGYWPWEDDTYNIYYLVVYSGEKDLYFTYDSLKENYDKVSNRFMYANSEDEALDKKEGTEKRKTFTGPLNIEEAIMLWLWDKMTFSLAEFSGNKNNGDLEYLPWLSTDEKPLFYYYKYTYLDGLTSKWKMLPSNAVAPYTRGEEGKRYYYIRREIVDSTIETFRIFKDGPHQVFNENVEGANYCEINRIYFPSKDSTGYNQRQQYINQTLFEYKSGSPISSSIDNLSSFNGSDGKYVSWKYNKDWAGTEQDTPTQYSQWWSRQYTANEILYEIFGFVTNLTGLDTANARYDLIDTYFHQMNLTTESNDWQTVDIQPGFTIYGVLTTNKVNAEMSELTYKKYIYDDAELEKLTEDELDSLKMDANGRYYEIQYEGEPEYTLEEVTPEEYADLKEDYKDIQVNEDGTITYYKKVYKYDEYKYVEVSESIYNALDPDMRDSGYSEDRGKTIYYRKVKIRLGQYYGWAAVDESDPESVAAYNAAEAEDNVNNVYTDNDGIRYYMARVTVNSDAKLGYWIYENEIDYTELVKFSLPRRNVKIYIGHAEYLKKLKAGTIGGFVIKYKDTDGKTKVTIIDTASSDYVYAISDRSVSIVKCLPQVPFYNYECCMQPFTIQHVTVPNPDIFIFAAIFAHAVASAATIAYAIAFAIAYAGFVLFYTIYILAVNLLFRPGILGFCKTHKPQLYYYYYDKWVNKYYKDAFNFYPLEWEKALNDNYKDVEFTDAEGNQVKVKMSRKLSRRFTNEKSVIYSKGMLDKEDIDKVRDWNEYTSKATNFGVYTALRFSFTMYFNKYFRKTRLIARMGYQYLDYFYKQLNGQLSVWMEQQIYPPDRLQFKEKFKTLRFMKEPYDPAYEGNKSSYYVEFFPAEAKFIFYCRIKKYKFTFDINTYVPRWRADYFKQGEKDGKDTYNFKPFSQMTKADKIANHTISSQDLEPMVFPDELKAGTISLYGTPKNKYTLSGGIYKYTVKTMFYKVPITVEYETEKGTIKREINLFQTKNTNDYTVFYKPRNMDQYVWDEFLCQKVINSFETRNLKTYLTNLLLKRSMTELEDIYKMIFNKEVTIIEAVDNMFNYNEAFSPENLIISEADVDLFYKQDDTQLDKSYTFSKIPTWYTAELSRFMSKYMSDNYNAIQAIITSDINDESIKGRNVAIEEIVMAILTHEIAKDDSNPDVLDSELPLNPFLAPLVWQENFERVNPKTYIGRIFTEDEIYDIGFYNYMVTNDPAKQELTLIIDKICGRDSIFLSDFEALKKGDKAYNSVWLPVPVDVYKKWPVYCKNLIASMYFIQEKYQVVYTPTVRMNNVHALRMYTAISIIGAIIMLIISILLAMYDGGTSVTLTIMAIIAIVGSIINLIGQLITLIAVFFPTNISRKLQKVGGYVSTVGAIISAIASIANCFGSINATIGAICNVAFQVATYVTKITEKAIVAVEQQKRDKLTLKLKSAAEEYNESVDAVWNFVEENEFEGMLSQYQPLNIDVKEQSLFDDYYDESVETMTSGVYNYLYANVDAYYEARIE